MVAGSYVDSRKMSRHGVGLLTKPWPGSTHKVTHFVSFRLPIIRMRPLNYLDKTFAQLATPERCLFALADLRGLLPELSEGALKAVVGRGVRDGMLRRVCHGLYLFSGVSYDAGVLLYWSAARLRAHCFNYLSLDSVLSDAGIISQVPINWITVMSSGRSQVISCREFGHIEFIHTKKRPGDLADELIYDHRCRLWRASVALALRDMRLTRRNLDLIDWEVAHEFF